MNEKLIIAQKLQNTLADMTVAEISAMLEKSGMRLLKVYDEFSFDAPKKDSERVFFVAQEQGKKR